MRRRFPYDSGRLSGVAYDAKVWVLVRGVGCRGQDRVAGFLHRAAESLEASYKAILLVSLIKITAITFRVYGQRGFFEAKIEEGDSCTVGIVSWPGFPSPTQDARPGLAPEESLSRCIGSSRARIVKSTGWASS